MYSITLGPFQSNEAAKFSEFFFLISAYPHIMFADLFIKKNVCFLFNSNEKHTSIPVNKLII